MTKGPPRNVAQSARQRLLNLAHQRGEDFQSLLTRYLLERLLFRLAASPHEPDFVLKGAVLFAVWSQVPHRATWDLDLLGRGEPAIPRLVEIFREICTTHVVDDGAVFLADSVVGVRIREDQLHEAVRLHLTATLGTAKVTLQVDVGFGDAIVPPPIRTTYPTLLGSPELRIKAYHRETVVAEKLEAMVTRGMGNSRMKDVFDLATLARDFAFEGATVSRALRATFERRRTPVPSDDPIALTREFGTDDAKRQQWKAFLNKSRIRSEPNLGDVISALRRFLLPPLAALRHDEGFAKEWPPGGPWR